MHHGFLWAVSSMGLARYLSLRQRMVGSRASQVAWPERIRLALIDLGPTYVKLGQLASTRADVFPPELIRALERLQDDIPAVSFENITALLEGSWQSPIVSHLTWLDPEPLATASIGQVHRATLKDDTPVVVKVRRPNIMEQAQGDFDILESLADLAERRFDWAKKYAIKNTMRQLVRTLRDELDFLTEANNTQRAKRLFLGHTGVLIPEVIWELTRSDILVMSEERGLKINDVVGWGEFHWDRRELARRFIELWYQQIFIYGFFQADPHPGNVHVDGEGHFIVLDWGLVGTLTDSLRRQAVELIMGMTEGRERRVVDALLSLGAVDGSVDRKGMTYDVERLRRKYYEGNLRDFNLGEALTDLLAVAGKYQIRVPFEFTLLAKTAVTLDGVVRHIDPDISLVELGKPFAWQLLWHQMNPENWVPSAIENAQQWVRALRDMPTEMHQALRTLSQGEIHIVLEHKNIDKILDHWEKLINRVALSVLLSALIIGTGLVVHPTMLDQMAGFSVAEYAFLGSVLLGMWVIIGAIRRKKI